MNLKLLRGKKFNGDGEEEKKKNRWLNAVDKGKEHTVKITTNKLDIEKDAFDSRDIKAVKNVKIIYSLSNGGCLILFGDLRCSFRPPYGGEFLVNNIVWDKKSDWNTIKGVSTKILFTNFPCSNDYMRVFIKRLINEPNFVYNMAQFDEFMDIFGFYQRLSEELNNNVTYPIQSISDKYYFVPVSEKGIEVEDENAVKNANGILIGYYLEKYKFEQLSSEQKNKVRKLVDIRVYGTDKELKKIRNFQEDLFLSDKQTLKTDDKKQFAAFECVDIRKENGFIILMGEYPSAAKYKYLHLYDMGQKIKLSSIKESLGLIKYGASGVATEMMEYIIGDVDMPSCKNKQIDNKKYKYVRDLDASQKKAFFMATDGSPVSLIKGPPGTGKTHVINAIVQYITKELDERVVISSQTHVAIDNVLDQLMTNYDLIIPNRITNRRNKYSGDEIDYTLYKTWAKNFSEHNARTSLNYLSTALAADMENFKGEEKFKFSKNADIGDYSVLGATTTTSELAGNKGADLLEGYDWLIIDEVSKCPITEVLRYLPYVKNIIMVGDDFQLAPLLEFTKEEVQFLPSYDEDKFEKLKLIYEQSVFAKTLDKAKKSGRLVTLDTNYRSVKSVLNVYNIFYDNKLINKREQVKPQKVEFTKKFDVFNKKDVFFVDVKNGKEAKENTSRYNIEELRATNEVLKDLIENTLNPSAVTVSAIFPYAAQIEKFEQDYLDTINAAKKCFKSFEIDTVDAFQGRESDIVLVNTVVTDTSQGNFLNDFRRINVAMSRARDKLFVFGNPHTLSKIDMKISGGNKRRYFADIIADIRRFGQIIVFDGGINYESEGEPEIGII